MNIGQLVSELVVTDLTHKTGINDRHMEGKNKYFLNTFLDFALFPVPVTNFMLQVDDTTNTTLHQV
jgi:hypothetical protein